MTFIGRQIIQLQNYPRALCSTEDWSQPEGYRSLLTLVPDELRRHVNSCSSRQQVPWSQHLLGHPPVNIIWSVLASIAVLKDPPHSDVLPNFGPFLPYLDKLLKCYFVGTPSLLLLLADDGCNAHSPAAGDAEGGGGWSGCWS